MHNSVVLTPMNRSHLDAVTAIEQHLYNDPWSRNQFLSEIAIPLDRKYIVVLVEHQVVGYVGVAVVGDDAHINNIAVDVPHQRQGIGRVLLHKAYEIALEFGATNLTLEVRSSNYGAQKLYESFGFRKEGIRRGYYDDNREDAIVMWLRNVRERVSS